MPRPGDADNAEPSVSAASTPSTPIATGGVMRCCLAHPLPVDAPAGTTAPCRYCEDGLRLVVDPKDGTVSWQAAWITLGHGWRKTESATAGSADA